MSDALKVLTTYIQCHNGYLPKSTQELVEFSMRDDFISLEYIEAQNILQIYTRNLHNVRQAKSKSTQPTLNTRPLDDTDNKYDDSYISDINKYAHKYHTMQSSDRSNITLITESHHNVDKTQIGEGVFDKNEIVPLNTESEEKSVHSLQTNGHETDEPTEPTKYYLFPFLMMIFMWLILTMYLLTLIVDAMRYLNWMIYLVIPLYIIYFFECCCCSETPSYLKHTKTKNEAKEYIVKLIRSEPSIKWDIEHYHEETKHENGPGGGSRKVNVVSFTEHRTINYESWMDKSVFFDLNDLDNFVLIKLKITSNQLHPDFMDSVSAEYYNDAKTKSIELTKKRDKLIRVQPIMSLVSADKDIIINSSLYQMSSRFIVKNNINDWKLHWFWYYLCCLLTISYFYRRWLDKQCVRREVIVKKAIKLNQKFPYCFTPDI